MGQVVIQRALASGLLADAIASVTSGDFAGILKAANLSVIVFTTDLTLNDNLLYTDLVQSVDAGLAPKTAITWGTVHRNQIGNYAIDGSENSFILDDDANTCTIFGAAVCDKTADPIQPLVVEKFDIPVYLGFAGDGFGYIPNFQIPASAFWGEGSVLG